MKQRSFKIAKSGVYNQSGLFVYQNNMLIFVGNFDGNILWNNVELTGRIGKNNGDGIFRLNFVVGFYGFAVHKNLSGIGSILNTVARHTSHDVGQVFVNPQERLPFIDFKPVMFVKILYLVRVICLKFIDSIEFFLTHFPLSL